MQISKAIEILEYHNKWRRYDYPEYGTPPKMIDPRQLGIAIDTIVNHYKNKEK